jgi:transcriptional regulator with XRE-family HTH domain
MPAWVSSNLHRTLIASLIRARKAAGLTQRDVAAKLGKPPSFVGKIEAIERNIGLLEFLEWCEAIGIEPTEILPEAVRDAPAHSK